MLLTLINYCLLSVKISLATFCYPSSNSKKCDCILPKIVSSIAILQKRKFVGRRLRCCSWFLSKIRGAIWLVQQFSTWIIDQSASSSYKSWHNKTQLLRVFWVFISWSMVSLFTYKPDEIVTSVEHLKSNSGIAILALCEN